MRYFFLLTTIITIGFANIIEIDSFEANFTQVVTNDAKNQLIYKGYVKAMKPQYALWSYKQPTQKDIYINNSKVTIVEPDIEQVIIKHISNTFNFFNMLKNAKFISKNIYLTKFQNVEYKIKLINNKIETISYQDELENSIVITFSNQIQNKKIDTNLFTPIFPLDYDLIED